jgi:DNA-binding IclR family transcriptional regulator
MAKVKKRLGIQSVEVAAGILRALASTHRSLPLKDLAKLAGIHPGKAHRYLVSLTRSELVTQDEATGHYGVGPAAIALGLAGMHSIDVVRTATAALPSLRDEINETVLLAMWSPHGPVVFALEESDRPVTMNIRVGSILPLLKTATGKVFATYLPRDTTTDLLNTELKAMSYSHANIGKLLEDVRRHGISSVTEDLVPGVKAIAAPLFDYKKQIVGVIGALGHSEEMDVTPDGPIAKALLRSASAISHMLGQQEA